MDKVEVILVDKRVSLGRKVARMLGLAVILLWIAYYSYNAGARDMLDYINSWPETPTYRT